MGGRIVKLKQTERDALLAELLRIEELMRLGKMSREAGRAMSKRIRATLAAKQTKVVDLGYPQSATATK
jgi:hypothetical protein